MLLKTKYDLDNAREQYGKLVDKQARKVLVCAGTGCVAGGSLNIYQKLIETISAKGLEWWHLLTSHMMMISTRALSA